MYSNQKTARLAGILYLTVAVCGAFAHFAVRGNIIVPGDATATVTNIRANEVLFRIGFVSDLLCQLCFTLLPLVLYKLLKSVDKNQASLMVVFALVGVPIACINMLNQLAALLILSGADYTSAFDTNQLNTLVMLFIDLQEHGVLIAQLFWGLWLLPLGYLVYKSGFFPKILGFMLMTACFVYLTGCFVAFIFPNHGKLFELIYIQPSIAELSFCFWLLIKGVKVQALNEIPPLKANRRTLVDTA